MKKILISTGGSGGHVLPALNLYDHLKIAKEKTVNIVVATSGDTGSAAIAALNNRENINLFVLHPHNKISSVQRKIMTATGGPNIYNIAVKGSFDDCQKIVKELFVNQDIQSNTSLTAINTINWVNIFDTLVTISFYFQTIMLQIVST